MKRDRDNLRRLIRETGFAEYEDYLMRHARPSIRVQTTKVEDESQITIGQSKIGGRPDLPRDMEWAIANFVHEKRHSLPFIAQFDMRDVKPFDEENLLPDSGILYFFGAPTYVTQSGDKAQVIFYAGDKSLLERRTFPEDLPPTEPHQWADYRFDPCTVKFIPEVNLPCEDADWIPPDYPEERWEEFDELVTRASYASWDAGEDDTVNRLLGYNYGIPFDMQFEAEIVGNGIYPYYVPEEVRKAHEPLKRNWQLLFQVDSDENANMAWNDMGTICFYIRHDDLKNRNFDNVVLTFFTA